MNARFVKFFQDLRASYWFLPSSMVLLSMLAAAVTLRLDDVPAIQDWQGWRWLGQTQAGGARTVLTVIASAVIGIAGVTFSITMVAVSFASSQYGPRLIGNFMRDRGNQATLGILIATFVYCLTILRTVRTPLDDANALHAVGFVPHASVLVAFLATLVCIGALIGFVHHVPETINVGNISARLGQQLVRSIEHLFPDRDSEQAPPKLSDADWMQRHAQGTPLALLAQTDGYIQTLAIDRLAHIAEENDLYVRLSYRPGDFALQDSQILFAWPESKVSSEIQDQLRACFAVGINRTAHQNVFFIVDQLVEVIARALSPGINDPFTACSCLDRVTVATIEMSKREANQPQSTFNRVLTHRVSFEDFLERMFGQAQPYLASDRIAATHAMAVLGQLGHHLEPEAHREAVRQQLQQLFADCETKLSRVEMEAVQERFEFCLRVLNDSAFAQDALLDRGFFGGSA